MDTELDKIRDHTFSQLTAMVADIYGSMMLPTVGNPTRNFQAGKVLSEKMIQLGRCPENIDEVYEWCLETGLTRGSLEGLNSLKYWPQIIQRYSIPLNDSSMNNLLYMSIYGSVNDKHIIFDVMTQSRELTSYCQDSVRPQHGRKYSDALNNIQNLDAKKMLVNSILANNTSTCCLESNYIESKFKSSQQKSHQAIAIIEHNLRYS